MVRAFPGGSAVKNLPEMQKRQETSLVGYLAQEDTLRRAWQPIPEFLPGESNGQRRLVGHSPSGRQELDTTEATEHTRGLVGVNCTADVYNCFTRVRIKSEPESYQSEA